MALESATYIHQLVESNPASSDGLNKADDHMRLIKSALKRTFPNITGEVTASQDVLNNPFPAGAIVLWSGAIADIPTGWVLCDGANSTPDLRNRFVVGAGDAYTVAATGGAQNVTGTTDVKGNHSHGGATASHALTIAQMPAHSHTTHVTHGDIFDGGPYSKVARYSDSLNGKQTSTQGGSEGHSHGIGSDGAHSHSVTIDNRPPYYALAYIMKL